MIINKTTTTEKRILKRAQRILPLVLLAICDGGPMGERYLAIFKRHDTDWNIDDGNRVIMYIPTDQVNWKFLREIKNKISLRTETSSINAVKHYFTKRCRVCQNIYYQKEISSEQFDNLSGNDNLEYSFKQDSWTAEISSCCDECTND